MWCDICRGDAEAACDLLKCKSCPKSVHLECAGLRQQPQNNAWACAACNTKEPAARQGSKSELKGRVSKVRAAHLVLKKRSAAFYRLNKKVLKPFMSTERFQALTAAAAPAWDPIQIGPHEPFVNATLRAYQIEGVNWILTQYGLGTGGILGDEMGLGKTIQTLAFLSALKAAGQPGPHLVVTPLAVLQNWANEIKRFTPNLSVVKVHGGQAERDCLLSDPAVLEAGFDVYLTTYDTLRAEEAFFCEAFLFHTVTIDEGHRLKNESSALCASLARVTSPFRLLLTGTPLQNNLHELWALLSYILPGALSKDAHVTETWDAAADLDAGQVDQSAVARARALLESLMLRRVKSEVEQSLLPKIEYVLKPPLTPLQRSWYRTLLQNDLPSEMPAESATAAGSTGFGTGDAAGGLLTSAQLMAKMMQLQKVCNHPKSIVLTIDRDRAAAILKHAAAAGSEFIKLPPMTNKHLSEEARAREAELRGLVGEGLVSSSGKLALLDRLLMRCKDAGSRVLLFSQAGRRVLAASSICFPLLTLTTRPTITGSPFTERHSPALAVHAHARRA